MKAYMVVGTDSKEHAPQAYLVEAENKVDAIDATRRLNKFMSMMSATNITTKVISMAAGLDIAPGQWGVREEL